jgi:hypothetical protein
MNANDANDQRSAIYNERLGDVVGTVNNRIYLKRITKKCGSAGKNVREA